MGLQFKLFIVTLFTFPIIRGYNAHITLTYIRSITMFVIAIATKPLNDGTKGRRFNVFNKKGFFRLRKNKSRGWFKTNVGATFKQFHFGKLTVAFEKAMTQKPLNHFAG
jgi:hypothetical protein